jgi:peptidyl-prolyl cis-trans isomerase D
VQPTPAEVRAAYDLRSRKTEVSFVKLNREEFLQAAQVSDEDVKKLYEERKETLKTDEKRKVRYAAFTLDEAGKALTGKERVEAMQKLADRAQEFAVAMAEPDAKFDEVAAKAEITPAETPEFSPQEPPQELGGSREIARAAFGLTEKEPNSDALAAADGYYVMQLSAVIPARPLTFEEAQPKLAEQLKNERASEAMNLRATELRNKIQAELQARKSFADAATAAGAKAESFPPFTLAQPSLESPDAREIITASVELPEGQMSDFVPTAEGGLLVHVDKRHPAEDEQFTKEQQTLAESLGEAKREAAFQDWLNERRAAANVVTGRS